MLLTKLIKESVQEEGVVAWFYTMSYRHPLPERDIHRAIKQPITHIELHNSGYPRINLPPAPLECKKIQLLDIVIRIFDCDEKLYIDAWTNASDLSKMMYNKIPAYNECITSVWVTKEYYHEMGEQKIIKFIHSLIMSRVIWLERDALRKVRTCNAHA